MAMSVPKTVEGVFEDRPTAQRALRDLRRAGFAENALSMIAREGEVSMAPGFEETVKAQSEAGCAFLGTAAGIVMGLIGAAAAFGAGYGNWVSLGIAVSLPLVGRVTGGLIGKRLRLGYRQSEQSSQDQDRFVVRVESGDRREEAVAILRDHDARFLLARGASE